MMGRNTEKSPRGRQMPGVHSNLGVRSNRDWWPNQLNLKILHQNTRPVEPDGPGFLLSGGLQVGSTTTR